MRDDFGAPYSEVESFGLRAKPSLCLCGDIKTKRADPLGIIGAPQFRQRLPDVLGTSLLLAQRVPPTPTTPCTSVADRSTAAARRRAHRGRWSDTTPLLSRA